MIEFQGNTLAREVATVPSWIFRRGGARRLEVGSCGKMVAREELRVVRCGGSWLSGCRAVFSADSKLVELES